jgi:hypothetical protein
MGGIPLQLMDAALSGLLPWGIGFGHSRVAVSLLEFSSELTKNLHFRIGSYHGRWHTITMKDKGQGLMGLTLALHWVGPAHPKDVEYTCAIVFPCFKGVVANMVSVKTVCGSCL